MFPESRLDETRVVSDSPKFLPYEKIEVRGLKACSDLQPPLCVVTWVLVHGEIGLRKWKSLVQKIIIIEKGNRVQ